MDEREWLARRFEENRAHLRAVAHRMLGSQIEAEDAVQGTWLRLSRSDATAINNLRAWLTTAVSRECLNMLQLRRSRREESFEPAILRAVPDGEWLEPEAQALAADSVGLALLVVLETLTPDERIAFVLHDVFAVPFDEIAAALSRSPAAARQLASRARRRVRGARLPEADVKKQQAVVKAFLAAARQGDFDGLIGLLDPDAVVEADAVAVRMARGALTSTRGAAAVAQTFMRRSHDARLAVVNGAIGAVWAPKGKPRVVFDITIANGRIVAIELIADPDHIREMDLALIEG